MAFIWSVSQRKKKKERKKRKEKKNLLPVVKSLLMGFYWSASLRIRCAGFSLTHLGWGFLLIFHRAHRWECGFKSQSLDPLFLWISSPFLLRCTGNGSLEMNAPRLTHQPILDGRCRCYRGRSGRWLCVWIRTVDTCRADGELRAQPAVVSRGKFVTGTRWRMKAARRVGLP